jgi:hypothetical protein
MRRELGDIEMRNTGKLSLLFLALAVCGCLMQPKPRPNPIDWNWEEELREEQRQREWEEEQRQREWEKEQRQREWEEEQRQLEINQSIEILFVNTGDSRLDDDYNLNTESVTIWNVGDWGVDMSGWKLYDKSFKRSKTEGHDFCFPAGFSLGPRQMVTIYSGKFDWSLYWKMEEESEGKGFVYELPGRESAIYFASEEGISLWILFWGKTEGEGASVWADLNDCAYLQDNLGNLIDEHCW